MYSNTFLKHTNLLLGLTLHFGPVGVFSGQNANWERKGDAYSNTFKYSHPSRPILLVISCSQG